MNYDSSYLTKRASIFWSIDWRKETKIRKAIAKNVKVFSLFIPVVSLALHVLSYSGYPTVPLSGKPPKGRKGIAQKPRTTFIDFN
jgi:hypothetical protein